jgi:hypothetical protein
MRITSLIVICLCFVLSAPAWAQTAASPAKPGILGYLDPHTGAFRPIPQAVPDGEELPASTVFTGTITITITVTLKTTAITTVTCTANVLTEDGATTTSPTIYEESDTVTATGSGTTRTCKISIPYSWSLSSQSSDTMNIGYTVLGTEGTTEALQRTANRSPLATDKVPANGATTALTAAVTL